MKKVLIITYYWPPAGGPGVQRVLKFAKYLPEYGWEPIILTVKNGEYPALDESLKKDVNPHLKVYKTRTLELYSLFKKATGKNRNDGVNTFILDAEKNSVTSKLFSWIRANVFIPDARRGWKSFAIKEALRIVKEHNIDLVFSSSPPHSLQLAALAVKKKTGLPWVADFRDPWTDSFWERTLPKSRWAKNKNLKLEEAALTNADHIVTVSEGIGNQLIKKKRINYLSIITNGFDEGDFKYVKNNVNSKIRIKYTGSIANSQIPDNLLIALSNIGEKKRSEFEISFFGRYDIRLKSELKKHKLNNTVILNEYIPHEQVVYEIINSDLLLLLIPRYSGEGILTGKLFEYIGTGNPILCVGPKNADAQRLIEKHKLGYYFDFDQDLSEFLRTLNIEKLRSFSSSEKKEFSRNKQTQNLAEIFNSLCP